MGNRHVAIELGDWVGLAGPRLSLLGQVRVRPLSVPFAILSFTLTGTIGAFATRYMHREPGFNRFFMLYSLFVLGMVVASLRTIETLFTGWELVGLSSALLVAFFQERRARRAMAYGFGASTEFRTRRSCWRRWHCTTLAVKATLTSCWARDSGPNEVSPLTSHQALVVGLLLLVPRRGKSALVPFSCWLPRAMEGPTPFKRGFYGALSVHLGAFLLLRASPLMERSIWLAGAVVALGLTTGGVRVFRQHGADGHQVGLMFRVASQVGLIVAEIGFGLRYVALVHILATHACVHFNMCGHQRSCKIIVRWKTPSASGCPAGAPPGSASGTPRPALVLSAGAGAWIS